MASLTIGHQWEKRAGVCPAILSITEIVGEYPLALARIQRPGWVVDYEFISFGRARVQSRQMKWRDRPAGMVHLYPPHVVFWEDSRQERGQRHSAWIEFEGGLEAGLGSLVHADYSHARFLDPTGRLGDLFRHAAKAGCDYGETGFWSAQADLCAIIDILQHTQPADENTFTVLDTDPSSESSEFVRQVEIVLKTHLGERVTLGSIARAVSVSVSTLAHRYRKETGETPMATLAHLRIERAKAMLLKGNPLKTVADQLGFCDPFHLSRIFKRVEGVSPRAFVKTHSR